jgi:membrane-bound ClpP family serine protease
LRSEWTIPLILQLVGFLVIAAEVLLPSGGILTVIALGLLGYSIYLVFAGISFDAGLMVVVADLILLPIAAIVGFKMLARSNLSLQTSLLRSAGVVSYDEKLSELLGKEGVAITNLRPSGTVLIEKGRIDVVTRGDYIEKGETVRVLKVEGSRVVVGKKAATGK